MASTNESIKLIIRTANNQHADFNLELPPSSTVYDLKEKITVQHLTKPVPKDQRLIFSGKLLDDSMVLNQIFLKPTTGSSFMIHLVLNSDKNPTTPKPQQATTERAASPAPRQPSPSTNAFNIPTHSSTYEQYLEELNKYQQQLQQFLINPNGIPPTANSETQAYLQYCYTHHRMYQNLLAHQGAIIPPIAINSIPTQQANGTTTAVPPPPVAAAAAAAPQPAAGGNNNNNNNEFEQENDLLGILNMLVELFVLCSIIYFYSTFSRFLVVFLIFALLYLHCRGYLSLQRRRRVQVQPAPVAPEAAAAAAAENDGEDEVEAEPMANDVQNQNDNNQRPPRPPPPAPFGDTTISTTRLLLTAVTTFFSSLIPERPQRT